MSLKPAFLFASTLIITLINKCNIELKQEFIDAHCQNYTVIPDTGCEDIATVCQQAYANKPNSEACTEKCSTAYCTNDLPYLIAILLTGLYMCIHMCFVCYNKRRNMNINVMDLTDEPTVLDSML